jgi:hypothetical protein
MSLTNYGEAYALDATLNTTNKWLALFTAAPGETGGGTEVSGGGYTRVAVTWAAAVQGAPSTKNPSGAVTFPQASADWGIVTDFAIFDSASAGNMVWDGALTVTRDIKNGDTPSFAAAQLTFRMD